KTGYTFAGWTPEVAATMPAEDVTYTATWTAIEYSITYDLAEGTLAEGMTNPTSYTIESENITLVNPIREGYTFEGWIGTDLAEATQSVTIAKGSYGDRNYTATWTANQYTVTFVLDNGEEDVVKTQDFGSELTAPSDPSKTGFTFKGWSPEVPAIVPASDQTFTAQWERNSYKLTWDVDGVKTESMVLYEAPITKPVDPEKTGYTFAGWTPEVATTMPAGDVTYTATWTAIEYSITYDLAGGTLAEGMTNPTSYTIESEDITLVNPAREGYTFEGWIGTDLTEPTIEVTIVKGSIGNRSYTATWTISTAISTIVNDSKRVNVYDLSGCLIRRNIPVSSLKKELPVGIYIVGGKKVKIAK
ncbi:MAG: InlB B-repeat-containing protein, partial [Prevotella sp.]|nr:InlB B-repeat-containing protein [Prevotella sp.]